MQQPFLRIPHELVVLAAGTVDDVRAERSGIVEDEVFEEGGAARDGKVGPLKRVFGQVVTGGEVETFEEGDFLGSVDGVFRGGHFHFQVVAEVEAQLSRPPVGRTSVEALLEDGVSVDIAGVVGVGLPVAQPLAAEIRVVVKRHGGVDDMAQRLDGTSLEVEDAVDAGGEGGGEAGLAVGAESAQGVDSHCVGDAVVAFPDGGPVPPLVVVDRVGPAEILEHLDAAAEGDGMLHAIPHAVERLLFEKVGILCRDVVVGSKRVGEGDVLVPAVGARGLLAAEGVDGGGAEGYGGQFDVHETRLHIVGFSHGGSEVEGLSQLCRVGDAGGGGAVEVVVAVEGVLAVVAALEVHVGRESAARVGLGILFMLPRDFEVGKLVESIAVALDAFASDAVADVEVALVTVAPVVVAAGFGRPAEVGVYVAQQGEINMVVEGEVVAAVFEVESAVVHPAVAGNEYARGASVGDGEKSERQRQRSGHVFDGDVGGTGDKFVAGDDFGLGEVDGEMGVGVIAGGVLSAAHIHHRVVHLFHLLSMQESFALLRDDTRDEAFLGAVVEGDGVGYVFGLVLLEEGVSADGSVAVKHRPCMQCLPVEIHAYIVRFQFHSVIQDDAVGVEVGLALAYINHDRVGRLVVDF